MAVLQMKHVSLCALKKDRKQVLELLQQRGLVEISDTPVQDDVFRRSDLSASIDIFTKSISAARQALEILDHDAPEKKPMLAALDGKIPVTPAQYADFSKKHDEVVRLAARIVALRKEIVENRAEILKLEEQREVLVPWMELDIPLDFQGTRSTSAFIGTLPQELTLESLLALLAKQAPEVGPVSAQVISSSSEQTCVFILTEKKDAEAVLTALTAMGFARPAVQAERAPKKQALQIGDRIAGMQELIAKNEKEIKSCASRRTDLQFLVDYDFLRSDKYKVIGRLAQSKRTFVLSGYVPAKNASSLEQELNAGFDIAVGFSDPGPEEDVPVLLKNNSFSAPLESVVESYSLPSRSEADPTTVMSLFYYVLFGMMLGDAAYGLIIAAVCGILLWKHKTMEQGMKRSLQMFFYCGVSTLFWGILFGSYFGDVVDVVSQTYFGVQRTIPALWFMPLNQPMRMLVFCMLVGIIHLYVGLGVSLYQSVRAGRYKDALYDVVFWYMLVTGLIILLLSTKQFADIFSLSFELSATAGNTGAVVAIVGAVGIIATGGRESRNPVKRLLKGLYSLYNVTGYLSDILSYSRLLALGLATSVIASVINKMAAMAGGQGPVGIVIFIAIFIVGHILNIGINALGAYVHTNRLQFVEFFGKFYSGGGRKFTPFSAGAQTKYYKFKEEN